MDQKVHNWNQKPSLQDLSINDKAKDLQDKNSIMRRLSKRNAGIQQATGHGQIHENFEIVQKKQSKTDVIYIVMCLKMHFVFSSLTETQLNQLSQTMFYCKLVKGETIIKQGSNASSFFIIEKGRIQVSINGVPKKELVTGNGFGELALLYNAPRSATCTALEDCYLWGIDRHTFRKSIEQLMRSEQERNRKYLEHVKFFNQLTKEQKDAIAGVLIAQKFMRDQIIVNEGDQASSFYIIAEGQVGIFKDGQLIRKLEANESFGEQALLSENQVRQMTVKAIEGEAKVLGLGRDMITKILGDGVQSIIYKNICKWAIKKSKLGLPFQQVEKLLDTINIRMLTAGSQLITKGDPYGTLVIVLEGPAIDSNKQVVTTKGEIVRQDTLMGEGKHDADYFLQEDGHVALMDFSVFRKQVGNQQQIIQTQSELGTNITNQVKEQELKDLLYLGKLGAGQFGSVYLCKFRQLDTLFALKYVTRAHVQQFGIQKHMQMERQVLGMMDYPFIMRFYRSFKDQENLYFLTEHIPGIELFDAIRIIGLLSKKDSQFYISQMLLQMEYLHSHQVIYRDIKPENVMVDDKGYLKLIDMGTAKPCASGQKTFTIIGTPHYMAPEVISGKGYNQTADLWSVGVCLYEFICGGLPFGEDAEDPFEIYKEIIKKNLSYPDYMSDKSAKVIIEQLMNKVPELRLGGSYTALKQNPWFKDFNWDALMHHQLKPPTMPPQDKQVTQAQVQVLASKNITVLDQILKDTANGKKVLAQPKDADWDNGF